MTFHKMIRRILVEEIRKLGKIEIKLPKSLAALLAIPGHERRRLMIAEQTITRQAAANRELRKALGKTLKKLEWATKGHPPKDGKHMQCWMCELRDYLAVLVIMEKVEPIVDGVRKNV